jgi:hypothetical protein
LAYDQLALKAPIDDPTFTTKITTPGLNIPTGATLNYFWRCTNAATGAGAWFAVSETQYNKGGWDANTNTPTLANGTGTNGWYYTCTVAGTADFGAGDIAFVVGDQVMYDGSIWFIIPNSIAVNLTGPITSVGNATSIASQTGTGTTFAMSAGPTFTGTSTFEGATANTTISGHVILQTRASANYLWSSTAGGYLLLGANGNALGSSNALMKVGTDRIYLGYGAGATSMKLQTTNTGISIAGGIIVDETLGVTGISTFTGLIKTVGGLHIGGTSDPGADNILADGTITATSNVYANGGYSVEWNDAYDHALIAAGTGVHISDAERTAWNAKQAAITFGIANTNAVKVDMIGVADNDYAKFTTTGLEGRSYAEVLSDIGAAATNQTFYIGTTQVAINRASAGLTLAGITLTTPVLGTPTSGTLTNCTNAHWEAGYNHSLIAGGTGVHISDAERTAWNAKQSATLSNGKILVGNASNIATAVTMTGDVTLTNAGVSAIGTGKVVNTMVATDIDAVKLADGTVTNTELQYINSVTSNVQTQLNAKQATINGTGFVKASGTTISYDNSTYQPLHASLTSISGLAEAAGTLIYGTADNTYAVLAAGTTSQILVGGGAAAPVWTTATGTGSPVRATSPTLVTPILGTPTSGTLTNCTQAHWDAAYTHSQIAGGNSVHVSTTENTQWDAAYTHSTDNTQAHSDYLLNNANDVTTGNLTATNFILSSDRRLKENISYIKNLHKFDVDFVQFNLKAEPNILRFGVIAQDLEKVAPELVRTDSEGMKSVAYIDLLCVKIAQLEQRVTELEKAEQKHIKRDWWFYKKIKNEK